MVGVEWHPEARRSVAPRTAEDVALGERTAKAPEWSDVRAGLKRTDLSSGDEEIAAALARLREMEARPKELAPLDMEVLFCSPNAERHYRFFWRQWGAVPLVRMLAAPALGSSWSQATGFVYTRKKGPPRGQVLRKLWVQLEPKARDECAGILGEIWKESDVVARCQLAYACFDNETWRAQAVAEMLEQAPPFAPQQVALVRDAETMRAILSRRAPADVVPYSELVASLGGEALPILLELAKTAKGRLHYPHTVAMTVLVSDEAARYLASCISHPQTRDMIGTYFEAHRDLAAAVLPAASQGASRNAALAKALMMKLGAGAVAPAPEATVGVDDPAVPAILREAPWRSPPPPLPPFDIEAYAPAVELSQSRKEEGLRAAVELRRGLPEMNASEAAAYAQKHEGDAWMWYFVEDGKSVPLELILEFTSKGKWGNAAAAMPLLATFGVRALPAIRTPRMLTSLAFDVVLAIDDPHLAYPLALSMLEDGQPRWPWFTKHPRAAALGLLASASEPDKRHVAETTLRRLAESGHAATILEVAAGDERIRAFLARDKRQDVVPVSNVTKVPVTRPRLKDGRALDDDAVARILEMLALSFLDEPYAGLDDVRAACDPRSLAEMAWDLAALADAGGRVARASAYPSWMRFAAAHFGDDEVIRRLTPALKHANIYRVLESLTVRGVRSAAMELATAHERGDAPGSMARAAQRLGRTQDELVETILPTAHLEEEGTTELQYGSRTLRVGFDTTLAPILFLGDKRLASLPRAKKDDDPVAIRLAREHWEELKEDVRTIAHLRSQSLEDAMRDARAIPASHFRAGWVNHALGKHMAHGMVWAALRDGALVTFRVAEDGSFADAHDSAFELRDDDVVRVPHHAELPADVAGAWLQTFSDYAIIQPVAQLARTPVPLNPPPKLDWTALEHKIGQPVPYGVASRILGEQHANGRVLKRSTGTQQFRLTTTWVERQSLVTAVRLSFRGASNKEIPFEQIDPVDFAEALFVMKLLVEAS